MLINLLLLWSLSLLEAFPLVLDRTAPLSPFLDETPPLSLSVDIHLLATLTTPPVP